jgi:hypothetical protein
MTYNDWENVYSKLGAVAMEIDRISGSSKLSDEGPMRVPYKLICRAMFEMYKVKLEYFPEPQPRL